MPLGSSVTITEKAEVSPVFWKVPVKILPSAVTACGVSVSMRTFSITIGAGRTSVGQTRKGTDPLQTSPSMGRLSLYEEGKWFLL